MKGEIILKNIETMIQKIEKRPRIVVNYVFWYDQETGENGIDVVQPVVNSFDGPNTWTLAGTVYNKSGAPIGVRSMTRTPVNQMIVDLRLETKVGDRTMTIDLGAREVLCHRANLEKDIGEMVLGEKCEAVHIRRRKLSLAYGIKTKKPAAIKRA